jgi:hypothetical protein
MIPCDSGLEELAANSLTLLKEEQTKKITAPGQLWKGKAEGSTEIYPEGLTKAAGPVHR